MKHQAIIRRDRPTEIAKLINHDERNRLVAAKLLKYHVHDLGAALYLLEHSGRQRLYKFLPVERLAKVFEHIMNEKALQYLYELEAPIAVKLLENMEADDATDIIQMMPDETQSKYFAMLSDQRRKTLRKLSKYAAGTVGSEMNVQFVKLNADMTVKAAMTELIKHSDQLESLDTLFVVDEDDKLIGTLPLTKLIKTSHGTKIKSLVGNPFRVTHVDDSLYEVVKDIKRYDRMTLPVLDYRNVLVGVMSMYDALDIIHETAHHDHAKLACVPKAYDVRAKSWKNAKSRLPWLFISWVVYLTITVVILANWTIEQTIMPWIIFLPLTLSMAGYSAFQSNAATILRLNRDHLQTKEIMSKHLMKEWLVTATFGLLFGILLSGFLSLLSGFSPGISIMPNDALKLALSIPVVMVAGSVMGCLLPLLLHQLKKDPAHINGAIVTVLADIVALALYIGIIIYVL